ncbi:MAG: serine/threonine-protein kinase [Myxococcota bacterium]|nr:serine/threonine-protein kinase [Myxococcota bacterium]
MTTTPNLSAAQLAAINKITSERYELFEELGRGGMSVVYRGHDLQLERDVAVKVMHTFLNDDPVARGRFHREAVAVAQLEHVNIIRIYDYAKTSDDHLYMVMELVNGPSLAEHLKESTPFGPPEFGLLVGRAIADALAHAHNHGIIHRDLKPENVLIGKDGNLRLTDFGIARILEGQSVTMTGTLLGSPAFMAPEYIEGNSTDHRVDIFAFGALLYNLTTGSLPFRGDSPAATLRAITCGNYVPATELNPQIHATIEAIIDRCLTIDPADRFNTAQELRQNLDRVLVRLKIEHGGAHILEKALENKNSYAKKLETTLVETYEQAAEHALKSGNTIDALNDYNRILATEPHNDGVLKRLDTLTRNQWIKRNTTILTAFLAAAGLVALLIALVLPFENNIDTESIGPAEEPKANPPFTISSVNIPTHKEKIATGTTSPKIGVRDENKRPPAAASTPKKEKASDTSYEVSFRTGGAWVNAFVDNEQVATNQMGLFKLTLSPGKHTVRFENPTARPVEFKFNGKDVAPLRPLLLRLRPKDAKLFINGLETDAVVSVAGRNYVLNELTRADPILVPFPPGQGRSSFEIVISTEAAVLKRTVILRPAETLTLDVALPPQ